MTENTHNPATLAAQALGWIDDGTRAISPSIHASSTFLRDVDNGYRSGREYIRSDNPAFDQPEALLAALEQGKDAALFASGMAAATAVFLALGRGEHAIAPTVMYWGLRRWLREWNPEITFVDMGDLDAVRGAIRPTTKLIWAETPSNPTWAITDLAAVAEMAHASGARLAVDSTCATPVLTQPLSLGADIVMHSATKYLNGHSDLVAGALATKAEDAFWERILAVRSQHGAVLGSFEAWLLLRGMRTLFVRVRQACANAMTLAERLRTNAHVAEVLYPGLKDHPGHAIAARQMKGGFGGMLSIRVNGGEQAAIGTAARVALWKRATSLGGVESLIEHRASIEGEGSPCPPDLLRLSVGIEDVEDLAAELEAALKN
ncbi:MAG: aminotransferase class I/II-fold pyridoxal phosphate-dependent enzyme [Alphaproteobacteria bacterium]|nr:aminotransferase class I/II-fold pyridoxal phosphate-dependent enzyme [Alphaproteobacteria bacterium]MBV9694788.1 aminotransferase class I/II-fold pyridoxal phosphate-dependent enzyme [Alphaproteobacteria bacterium]